MRLLLNLSAFQTLHQKHFAVRLHGLCQAACDDPPVDGDRYAGVNGVLQSGMGVDEAIKHLANGFGINAAFLSKKLLE